MEMKIELWKHMLSKIWRRLKKDIDPLSSSCGLCMEATDDWWDIPSNVQGIAIVVSTEPPTFVQSCSQPVIELVVAIDPLYKSQGEWFWKKPPMSYDETSKLGMGGMFKQAHRVLGCLFPTVEPHTEYSLWIWLVGTGRPNQAVSVDSSNPEPLPAARSSPENDKHPTGNP